MSAANETFAENARQFCLWVESPNHDVLSARQHLLALLQGIPYLSVPAASDDNDQEYLRRGHEGWKCDMDRLSDFPLRVYRLIFAPCDLDNEPPITATVQDDLAGIYEDIWHGLQALNAGDAAYAFVYWRDSYFDHWGPHASAAIYAIDEYYRKIQHPDADISEE